jgi:hypothetical protein
MIKDDSRRVGLVCASRRIPEEGEWTNSCELPTLETQSRVGRQKVAEDDLEMQSSRDKGESSVVVAIAVAGPPTFRRVLLLVVLERGERVGLDRLGGCHG